MATVAGASRYLNSAVLANQQGISPSTPSLLGTSALNPTSLLDAGRRDTGIGLSGGARVVNNQLINQSRTGFNQIFSLNGVEFGTPETLQQKILALRASVPESRLSESVRGEEVDQEV